MTKLKIKRIFAFIFIALSVAKVIFSLFFNHTEDLGETIFHYVESVVHIILLVFLCKHAIRNKIGHFFHEYFLEAIIMGIISTIALIYTCVIHHYEIGDSFMKLLPITLSIGVNVFLLVNFHHLHDHTVKIVLIVFVALSLLVSATNVLDNILAFANGALEHHAFISSLISNLLTLFFNLFVLLTAMSMKHVLRSDPSKVVNYVKLREDE